MNPEILIGEVGVSTGFLSVGSEPAAQVGFSLVGFYVLCTQFLITCKEMNFNADFKAQRNREVVWITLYKSG